MIYPRKFQKCAGNLDYVPVDDRPIRSIKELDEFMNNARDFSTKQKADRNKLLDEYIKRETANTKRIEQFAEQARPKRIAFEQAIEDSRKAIEAKRQAIRQHIKDMSGKIQKPAADKLGRDVQRSGMKKALIAGTIVGTPVGLYLGKKFFDKYSQ